MAIIEIQVDVLDVLNHQKRGTAQMRSMQVFNISQMQSEETHDNMCTHTVKRNPFNCKKSYKHHLQNPVSLKCSLCFQNERSAVAIYRQFSAKFDGGGNSLFGDLEKSETFLPNFS